jgi:DNA-binding transcriptional ArsR family regulator
VHLDDTLIALADPTRRAILERLRRGPARVTDVARPFRISLNSVSKHIRILERAELIKRRVSGREHLLSFNPEPLHEAEEWIQAHRSFWTEQLDDLEARLKATDPSKGESDEHEQIRSSGLARNHRA